MLLLRQSHVFRQGIVSYTRLWTGSDQCLFSDQCTTRKQGDYRRNFWRKFRQKFLRKSRWSSYETKKITSVGNLSEIFEEILAKQKKWLLSEIRQKFPTKSRWKFLTNIVSQNSVENPNGFLFPGKLIPRDNLFVRILSAFSTDFQRFFPSGFVCFLVVMVEYAAVPHNGQ